MASGTSTSAASSPPRLAPDCDVRKLPISPTEAFVLSRIDGQSQVVDLSNATGLPESTVIEALQHLSAVGAIRYGAETTPRSGPGSLGDRAQETVSTATRDVPTRDGPTREVPESGPTPSSDKLGWAASGPDHGAPAAAAGAASRQAVLYDESLLDEAVEIPLSQRKELLELYFSIEIVSHYELLGVPPDAERKAIKQAYFERVNVLHPDRFFGRNIGSYKARIDRVFTALTKAHDTLTKRQARADYDSYLESRKETTGLRSSRVPTPPSQPPTDQGPIIPTLGRTPQVLTPERITPEGLTAAVLAPGVLASGVRASGVRASGELGSAGPLLPAEDAADERISQELLGGRSEETPYGGRATTPPLGQTGTDDARRQMARKLKAGASQPPPSHAGSGEDQVESARRALEANLRARYEARLKDPNAPTRFLALAAEAERAQNWASAVSALKAAAELKPDDSKITAELARVELLADRAYAGKFAEQARYEERDGQFERASRSYERAARGRGSAELYVHAALCQLRADRGGRRAVELARRAVALAPTHVASRLALARAYFQEGMTASALAEATRALEVDPKSDEAKRLQAEFRKSG